MPFIQSFNSYLIIFTRYPEPGVTKTRLIPALGEVGAATLQRQMIEQTLTTARLVCPSTIAIWFTGGSEAQMQAWLGDDLKYHPQSSGDLGDRMATAFQVTFAQGADRAVIIGTDCPALTPDAIAKAFELLDTFDLVLGPAMDGGYYLMGLNQFHPALFAGIAWSTDQVLSQTVTIAETLSLTTAYLAPLTDIDRPEDLASLDPTRWYLG